MKKLLVLLVVLSIATVANAALELSIDGVVNGPDIMLLPSQTVKIDVFCDGTEIADAPGFIVLSGPGVLNIDNAINVINDGAVMFWEGEPADGAVFMDFSIVAVPIPAMPAGVIADNIILHCDAIGDVTLSLYLDRTPVGGTFQLMDTVVIHQIPEPMTLGLLGLGGLFLRRRK